VVFAPAARYPKTKKPGAGYLACHRLGVAMVYFFLTHPPLKPWTDLSKIPVIIVARKYTHFSVLSNLHVFLLHEYISKMPRFILGVKQKTKKGHSCVSRIGRRLRKMERLKNGDRALTDGKDKTLGEESPQEICGLRV